MSSTMDDVNLFTGTGSGISSAAFLRLIRREALNRNMQADDSWIAHLAASYFDDVALEWYEELDSDTQDDWRLLRKALLQRWPPSGESGQTSQAQTPAWSPSPAPSSSRSMAPIPAAAPASAPAPAAPIPVIPPISTHRLQRGRIKVIGSNSGTSIGWLTDTPDAEGDLHARPNVTNAMIVEFSHNVNPHAIKIMTGQFAGLFLGVVWHETRALEKSFKEKEDRLANLTGIERTMTGWKSKTNYHNGPVGTTCWTALMNGTMRLHWSIGERSWRHMTFDTAISPSDMVGETIVVSKYESSTGKRGWADSLGLGACSWEPSHLEFEPL